MAGMGDSVVRSLGLAKAGEQMGFLEMMVRGAFLDGRVYRQAALDANGNGAAAMAVLIPFVAAAIGTTLFSSLFSFGFAFGRAFGLLAIYSTIVSAVVGIGSLIVGLGVMSALSQQVTGWKVGLGQIFRALAYAQSPGVFGIIPVLGWVLGLWRLPTSLAAIREITGGDTGKAAILLVIGVVAMIILGMILSPLLLAGFAFLH